MSLIGKTGFEKNPNVWDVSDNTGGTILASNSDRIDIVFYTYLEVSIKESTKIGRAKKEPIDLNLDSPVSLEITKFWYSPSVKSVFKFSQEITYKRKGWRKEYDT